MSVNQADIDALRTELKVERELRERAERQLAEANQEIGSQRATIKSLCDRLDKIHGIATRSGLMAMRLTEIAEWSGGFAPAPKG
jgi:chromosome segregation ATPase